MDLPPGPIVEAFSREVEQSKVLLTSFLELPPVKALQFALEVGLGIGRTDSPSHKNKGLAPLPTVYTLRDDNIFRINLQSRHTKSVKAYDTEVETAIWNDAAAGVLQGGYRAKLHEPLLQHLRNIMAKRFKRNLDRSFVQYMVEAYDPSMSVWQGDISRERGRDLEEVLEALELVSMSNFWSWDNGSSILFWIWTRDTTK